MKDKNIRIAIADDHKLIREALKTICILPGLEVVIEARNGQSLIDKVENSAILPHVCIVDGSLFYAIPQSFYPYRLFHVVIQRTIQPRPMTL